KRATECGIVSPRDRMIAAPSLNTGTQVCVWPTAVYKGFSTKPSTFNVLIWFHDKANPIRRAVVRREWRYKPHCCQPGLRVSSLGARSAVPRQNVPPRHMRRPKCEESLDRYYP